MNDIAHVLDNKHDWVSLFNELSKALDMADHDVPLKHLCSIGFVDESCKWFKNNLSGSVHAVMID